MTGIELIKDDISRKLNELGYSLYSIKLLNQKSGKVLEIVVDKDEAIDLNDIVNVSNELSTLLDDLIKDDEPYTLDVSSLGIEKPISVEKIDKYVGKYLWLHLSHPVNGLNILEGDLTEVDKDTIVISLKEKTRVKKIEIEKKYIDKARLAIKF